MWVIQGISYTDDEATAAGLLTRQQMQVYDALQIAAERMGTNAYYAKRKQAGGYSLGGKRPGKLHFIPTQEHRDVVDAMPKVLSGKMSPEAGMALLHQYEVFQQRF